ncbi:amino acid transporter [Bifidobacterium dolichotidis]|uniref:Amino acid transporter n=1 Tax=Bifidobacterium dolichotidis TaxID=2306976 RepID=A0A430FRT9_9BIFI|nr:APC family permease [Bifidobacterium dolichotidis]RSX55584.1 amino acid transporter [Bifidobacterium dolichotidis]
MNAPLTTNAHAQDGAKVTHEATVANSTGTITTLALTMMTVATVAHLTNDVQMAFYGLSSVTFFIGGCLLFFVPTGLVAAELASGWSQKGGIFRWVGEGLGRFPAIACLLILWFRMAFMFGSSIPTTAARTGFFTADFDRAVQFAEESHPLSISLPILLGWLVFYWFICWCATRGVKVFASIAKYGVIFGTFVPLAIITVLCLVWLAQGHRPAIDFDAASLIPTWQGMPTLALAAIVFLSYAGIDINAAHINNLKKPSKQFPLVVFISMVLSLGVFIVGTLVIAMVEPNINLVSTLVAVYRDLGAAIGFPQLYIVLYYLATFNTFAVLITNLAGPSRMLGEAGRSGFLPKWLQENNKFGMPSRLIYLQMGIMTAVAFVVFLLPNVEGFMALIGQLITILCMVYYIVMFVAFLKLRYDQPNRPRSFKVPGGMVGAWITAGVGMASATFAIALAFVPPAQLLHVIGSELNYILIILCMIGVVALACVLLYRASLRHTEWLDTNNNFAPFTWQIEGLAKPGRVASNVPSDVMCADQHAMGMPIKRSYDADEIVDLAQFADTQQTSERQHTVNTSQYEFRGLVEENS